MDGGWSASIWHEQESTLICLIHTWKSDSDQQLHALYLKQSSVNTGFILMRSRATGLKTPGVGTCTPALTHNMAPQLRLGVVRHITSLETYIHTFICAYIHTQVRVRVYKRALYIKYTCTEERSISRTLKDTIPAVCIKKTCAVLR